MSRLNPFYFQNNTNPTQIGGLQKPNLLIFLYFVANFISRHKNIIAIIVLIDKKDTIIWSKYQF